MNIVAVLVNNNTRILVQGITGREGANHTRSMLQYGTKVVAGVTPGKKGAKIEGIPVFDSVQEAIDFDPKINTSVLFVPARQVEDAVYEAADSAIPLIVIITEHVPVHSTIRVVDYALRKGLQIVGPNCPGVISPGLSKVGIMPGHLFSKGKVGMVSRSGTLTYEIASSLTRAGIGQSTAIGIGGDPVIGLSFMDAVQLLEDDPETEKIVIVGEIGGDAEERLAASRAKLQNRKPMVSFVAGRAAPPGRRMGHAGAIISMGSGTAEEKTKALREAGIPVADLPSEIPDLLSSNGSKNK